jgi:hypothetical protein
MTRSEDRSRVPFGRSALPVDPARYVVALGALAAALLFRYLVRDSLGLTVPYLQFYPAIIVAAWYGGLGPTLTRRIRRHRTIQVLGSQMSDGGTKGQVLNEIILRIDALDQMMKDLLLFARPPKPRRAPTDLVSLVTTTADLLS